MTSFRSAGIVSRVMTLQPDDRLDRDMEQMAGDEFLEAFAHVAAAFQRRWTITTLDRRLNLDIGPIKAPDRLIIVQRMVSKVVG